jgi:hypothetical protein
MMKTLLENWKHYLKESKFKNELGNDITIDIKRVKDTGINSKGEKEEFEAIEIMMEVPTSTSTNTITKKEAMELYKALGEFLKHRYGSTEVLGTRISAL